MNPIFTYNKPTAIAKVNNSNISFEVETTGAINAGNDHISYASTNANYDIIANESHEFVIFKKNVVILWVMILNFQFSCLFIM